MPIGHRERKKQRTREQIVAAAYELFRDRGYHATTVADVAAAADIAPRTFFAYFPSKEAVVFHNFDELFEALKSTIEGRPPEEGAIDALRRFLEHSLPAGDGETEEAALRKRLCIEDQALAAQGRHLLSRLEDVLREGVARDLGEPPDALRPKLVAAAATAALNAIDEDRADKARSMELLDEALIFLRAGVEALRPQQA
jgi:AcrR family transcriptional regulator